MARILSPSPNATNGALRATRREARATGFDCGAGGAFLRPLAHWPVVGVNGGRVIWGEDALLPAAAVSPPA